MKDIGEIHLKEYYKNSLLRVKKTEGCDNLNSGKKIEENNKII